MYSAFEPHTRIVIKGFGALEMHLILLAVNIGNCSLSNWCK